MAAQVSDIEIDGKVIMQVTAGAFETAGLRGEDRMEDRHIISSPMSGANAGTHLLGDPYMHGWTYLHCIRNTWSSYSSNMRSVHSLMSYIL